MYEFGEKHPIGFEIILIIVSFLAAGVIVLACSIVNMHPDLSSSIARIFVALVLLVIYRRAFTGQNIFKNPVIVIPSLLFAVWNVFYNLSSGMVFGGGSFFVEAAITAIAPALFEEVIFRGIFIYNLKKKGSSDLSCLFITAAVFAAVHLTNLVGQSFATVALQTGYSFVVGLALAAVYLRNHSIVQVVLAHFLIDFTNRLYLEQATSASYVHLAIFVVLLIAEAAYAVKLTISGQAAEG